MLQQLVAQHCGKNSVSKFIRIPACVRKPRWRRQRKKHLAPSNQRVSCPLSISTIRKRAPSASFTFMCNHNAERRSDKSFVWQIWRRILFYFGCNFDQAQHTGSNNRTNNNGTRKTNQYRQNKTEQHEHRQAPPERNNTKQLPPNVARQQQQRKKSTRNMVPGHFYLILSSPLPEKEAQPQ